MDRIKAARICCFTLGTALLLSALFLVVHNLAEDRQGREHAGEALRELKEQIPDETEPVTTMLTAENYDLYEAYETTPAVMDTVVLDGNAYIGYLSIPELDIELPVLADWSYPGLKTAPCRYQGTVSGNDMIICAHNYSSHFGRIPHLHTDAEIIFTDVNGKAYCYAVVNIVEIPGTAVEEITFGNAEDWDLTLFTCTLSGQSRVTVRAVRTDAD